MEQILLLFFSFLTEAVIVWQYASNLFFPKHSLKSRLFTVGILYFVMFLFSLLRQPYLNVLLFLGTTIIFFYLQFRLTLPFVLFHSAILTAVMSISELAAMGIITRFFPHFIAAQDNGLFFYGIFSKSLFFMTVYFLTHILGQKNDASKPYDRSGFFLMAIPASSVFIMFTFLKIGETAPFIYPANIMVTVSSLFLLLANLFVFGINQYNQKKSLEFTEMQLLLQKESDSAEYYAMLLSQTENQNILIHDLKKHLESIRLLSEKGATEQINAYIHQLMDASDLKETSQLCDNAMLNAILSRYQRRCYEKKIGFHADIRKNTTRNLCQNDLTSLFCNLLDNAVEAAENIPESFIELSVQKKETSPLILIILINSCRNAPVYDPNGLPVSGKHDNGRHGFGIKSIQKIVKKYRGNMQMYYDDATATFHTVITLKQ